MKETPLFFHFRKNSSYSYYYIIISISYYYIIISISYYFLLVTFLFLSFRVLGCLRNLKFMIDLHGLFVFLNMNYQKLGVDYY